MLMDDAESHCCKCCQHSEQKHSTTLTATSALAAPQVLPPVNQRAEIDRISDQ